jgi:transposase
MFWGAFSYYNRTALTPMLGDPNSARGGVTGRVVRACLEEQLPTIASPGSIFQQDNASTHTAHVVQDWLRPWAIENGVELMNWPPYSPDLNPIENLWKLLKEAIQRNHPDLDTAPKSNESLQRLAEAAVEAWEALEDRLLESLVESMRRRLEAVIRARGWYTKY